MNLLVTVEHVLLVTYSPNTIASATSAGAAICGPDGHVASVTLKMLLMPLAEQATANAALDIGDFFWKVSLLK